MRHTLQVEITPERLKRSSEESAAASAIFVATDNRLSLAACRDAVQASRTELEIVTAVIPWNAPGAAASLNPGLSPVGNDLTMGPEMKRFSDAVCRLNPEIPSR